MTLTPDDRERAKLLIGMVLGIGLLAYALTDVLWRTR